MNTFLLVLSGIYNFLTSLVSGLCFALVLDFSRTKQWFFHIENVAPLLSKSPAIIIISAVAPLLVNAIIIFSYNFIINKMKNLGHEVTKIRLSRYILINGVIYVLVFGFALAVGLSSN